MKGNIALDNLFSHYGGLIIIILAFVLYGNTIGHKFSIDDEYVVKNEYVKKGITAIPEIFSSYYSGNDEEQYGYRPIARSVYAIEYSVFGMNTKAFHATNVLLYGIACWLLFILFRRMKKLFSVSLAILSVMIFTFHPVHTEVVNSLKNSEEMLSLIFSLLSLFCFLRYAEYKSILYLFLGGILLFAGYLSKETALVFALIIPLCLYVNGANIVRILISALVAFAFIFSAYKLPGLILPPAVSHVESWQNPVFGITGFSTRLSIGMLTLEHYGLLLLFPYRLLFYYGFNTIPLESVFSFSVIISFLIHVALIVVSVIYFRKHRALSFGILFYLFAVSIFTNIYMPITGIVGDRLIFTASAGFSIIIAYLFSQLLASKRLKKAAYVVLAVTFIFYTYRTYSRNGDWKNTESLFESDIPYLEKSVKANDLYASFLLSKANSLLAAGKKPAELTEIAQKAVDHFKKATEVLPEYYNAWNNLGAIYLTYFNDTANAIFAFNSAVKYKPDLVTAHHNLGYIYYRAKKYGQAKAEFRLALYSDSNYIPSQFNYGEILTIEQMFDSAEYYFLKIYKQDSTHTGALLNLGSLEILKGDTLKAIKYFEPAVEKDRSNKALMMNISAYYLRNGDTTKAGYYRKMAGS